MSEVLEADIDDFFGSIEKAKLMELVAKRILDKKILRLIKQWLDCGIMEDAEVKKDTTTGTPHGGVISPLLANIYLNELDKEWKQKRESGMNAVMVG